MADVTVTVKLTAGQFRTLEAVFDVADVKLLEDTKSGDLSAAERSDARDALARARDLKKAVFS